MLIHKFSFLGTLVVLDVNSGSVHIVDELLHNLLDIFDGSNHDEVKRYFTDKYSEKDIVEGLAELDDLIAENILFSPAAQATDVFQEQPLVKSLCLHVAHDCNLRCKYCFAGTGDFGTRRSLMSKETGEKAIEFALKGSGSRKNIDIDFFGGEPLVNSAVVRHLINYARQREQKTGKKLKLTLTTNGVLLDGEMTDFLDKNNVLLVLSLDGRPEVHDRMRPFAGGKGSYAKVTENFIRTIKARGGRNYYLRGTYTKENLDFAEDVKHMATLGKELSMEPVVDKDAWYRIQEDDLPQIFSEYEKLSEFYLERYFAGCPFNFFHFNLNLDGGPCLIKRLSGCGAGHEYFAITPDGDIYPCHQFVGREEYLLGNLEEGIKKSEIGDIFRNAHVLNKPNCMACWAKFYCSGGCHANADLINGDIYQPYELGCQLQRKRLECAIGIQVKIAEKE